MAVSSPSHDGRKAEWKRCLETRGGLTCERCLEPIRFGDRRYWLTPRAGGVDRRRYWRRLCRWCGDATTGPGGRRAESGRAKP